MSIPHQRLLSVALTAACVVFGLAGAFGGLAWSDPIWYLHTAGRVLDGAALYRDIIETNPPLVVWLHLPIVSLARLLDADTVTVWRLSVAFLLLASATLAAYLLRSWSALPWLAFALFVVGDRGTYGQRDHLILALLLPWLAGALRRIQGRPSPAWLGIPAALAFALKPHYVLLWPLVYWLQARKLSWRPAVWLPEHRVMLAAFAVYGLAVLSLTPDYLGLIYRVLGLYGSFRPHSLTTLLVSVPTMLAAFALILALLTRRHPRTDLLTALVAACLGAMLLQGKGYDYHYYPAHAAAVLLLLSLDVKAVRIAGGLVALLIAFFRLPEAWGGLYRNEHRDMTIVRTLRSTYSPSSFAAIDPVGTMTPFRYAYYGGVPWHPRWPYLWPLLLPPSARADAIIADELGRMARHPTDLLLIRVPDTGGQQISDLPYPSTTAARLAAYPAYDSLLRHYTEEPSVAQYRVFRLRGDGQAPQEARVR